MKHCQMCKSEIVEIVIPHDEFTGITRTLRPNVASMHFSRHDENMKPLVSITTILCGSCGKVVSDLLLQIGLLS